jgi:hypothetical protein
MRHVTTATASSVIEVVEGYKCFLARNHYDAHWGMFERRLASDRKAAEAEAVVFSLLWFEKMHPDVFEKVGAGGPDFQCQPSPGAGFLTEVTSLDSTAVSHQSGLPLKITGAGGQAYGLITDKLLSAVKGKTRQLGGQALPGVLVITSDYDFSCLLMDSGPAQRLLTGDVYFTVPIGGGRDSADLCTDLDNAAFCRRMAVLDPEGNVMFESCRRSISAILLVTIHPDESSVVGLLHPDPVRPFDPSWFPEVSFVRLRDWPITGGKLGTEWVLGKSGSRNAKFPHRQIR